jgi:hypothetical protein
MFENLRTPVLHVLRVPHDPTPPAGAPGSVRVFRAGQNFYKLRLFVWGFGQIGALLGIVFSLTIIERVEDAVQAFRAEARQAAAARATATAAADEAAKAEATKSGTKKKSRADLKQRVGRTVESWPMWVFPLLKVLEWGGVLLYLIQIPITYAMARLDFEMRWYIVTDRSLRIRSGLATVEEITMSFANLQQVVVTQGPLQRLLGLANVCVQSAGGGGGADAHGNAHNGSGHMGVFRGVDNANEIRDLILARLRSFRETGLGDPDEPRVASAGEHAPRGTLSLAAAKELLDEARALKIACSGFPVT